MSLVVAVGSTNPTKTQPVREIFTCHFSHVIVKGVDVNSGVSEQPMSDDEMYKGALNRATKALKKVQHASFGVGIEGGVHHYSYGWFERSLVVIIDKNKRIGIGSSGGLKLPKRVIKKIHQGETLEQAIDTIFGTKHIGKGVGMFGVMTKNIVTRTDGVKHGVAFALARFLHQDIYDET